MLIFLFFLFFSPILFFLLISSIFQFFKLFQKPKLIRPWDNLFKELPKITEINSLSGEFFVQNIRNAKYNPIFEFENKVEYLNQKYNIKDLEKLWLFVNPYGPFQSHVLLSFQFGKNLAEASFLNISYELRKVNAFAFQIYKVIFKNFEGMYLLSKEEDTIFVRTNVRNQTKVSPMYCFPLNISKEKVTNIFLNIVKEVNIYNTKAFWYRVFRRNCLTEIFKHLKQEKVLDYNPLFGLLNINKLIYKSNIVQNMSEQKEQKKLSYTDFLKKYKIDVDVNLKPDEHFSFLIRTKYFN